MRPVIFRYVFTCFTASLAAGHLPAASADLFDHYSPTGSFELPGPGPYGERRVDVLNDGRITVAALRPGVGADVGAHDVELYIETGVRSRVFNLVGVVSFSAANLTFLRVRPDGTKFAVGDFDRVGVCEIDTLECTVFDAEHFDAEWYDDRYLALTGSIGGVASMLDTMSPNPGDPINPVIIQSIPGWPAGITFDVNGNLFVGTWTFDAGSPFRSFENPAWIAAWNSGSPLDFETDGALIVDVVSAVSPGFDSEGNFYVGGGGVPSLAALVRASAVADAIAGLGPADPDDRDEVRRFPPECYHLPQSNLVTGELYIRCYAESTVDVYAVRPVPGASEWSFVVAALVLLTVGTIGLGARRMSLASRYPNWNR